MRASNVDTAWGKKAKKDGDDYVEWYSPLKKRVCSPSSALVIPCSVPPSINCIHRSWNSDRPVFGDLQSWCISLVISKWNHYKTPPRNKFHPKFYEKCWKEWTRLKLECIRFDNGINFRILKVKDIYGTSPYLPWVSL